MLEVQKFLQNGTLEELAIRYNIKYDVSEELDVVVLSYSNLSPMSETIVRECRGLFLELDTWRVVGKSMTTFFENYESQGQIEETKINWGGAKLIEKLDGALIIMYYYKGKWRVGTRLSADGSAKVAAIHGKQSELTFAELTEITINDMGYSWEQFTEKMIPAYTYSFELTSPETRYGVLYLNRKLTLIAITDNQTFEDKDIYTFDYATPKKDRPLFYNVNNIYDVYNKLCNCVDPLKYEGFVLLDGNGKRIKYKNPEYVSLMHPETGSDDLKNVEDLLEYVLSFSSGGSGGYSIPRPPATVKWYKRDGYGYYTFAGDLTATDDKRTRYTGPYSAVAKYGGPSYYGPYDPTSEPNAHIYDGKPYWTLSSYYGGSSSSYVLIGHGENDGPCGQYIYYNWYGYSFSNGDKIEG